jgi:hypothetical protein
MRRQPAPDAKPSMTNIEKQKRPSCYSSIRCSVHPHSEIWLIRAFKTSNLLLAINQDPDMLDTTLTAPTLPKIRAAGNMLAPS